VLADSTGPFGNPTSDSARTMITTATTRALVVVYAPAAYNPARLDAVLDGTSSLLRRYCGGSESGRLIRA
jgi:DNA/RNA-binding domain of Phe-tRNA-synthetase-like protein